MSIPGLPKTSGIDRKQLLALTSEQEGFRFPALQQFHAKLATVDTDTVDVLFLWDSNGEGGTTTDPNKNAVAVFRDQLRRAFQPAGIVGGFGWMTSYYARSGVVEHWTVNSGSIAEAKSYGLGRKRITINANSQIQASFIGTKIRLFFAKSTGGGNFTVNIDGVDTVVSSLGASTLRSQTWDSATLSAGAHVVRITTTTPALSFEGALAMNGDEAAGIRVWNGSQSGYKTGDFVSTEVTNLGAWLDAVDVIQPDLVVIILTTNDFHTGVPFATYEANLVRIIADMYAHTVINPSIVLGIAPERYDPEDAQTPRVPGATYADYANIVKRVAAAQGTAVIDLRNVIAVGGDTNGTGSIDADKVHFTPAGEGMIGRALARFVSP